MTEFCDTICSPSARNVGCMQSHVYLYMHHRVSTVCCLCCRNGMLREAQLSSRNMVNAVTDEFWKMVRGSINDQALHFKSGSMYMYMCMYSLSCSTCICTCTYVSVPLLSCLLALRYNLEAEWRNRYPGGRTLDRVRPCCMVVWECESCSLLILDYVCNQDTST